MLRTAVHTDRPPTLRVEFEPKLCGDHYLVAKRRQPFADQFFICERTINFGSVEEGYAVFDCSVEKRHHLLFVSWRPVSKAHSHATQPDCRYFQPALSKFALFHAVAPKNVSRRDHYLDGFPVVHCAVTIRDIIKRYIPIEYATRLDPALKDVWQ